MYVHMSTHIQQQSNSNSSSSSVLMYVRVMLLAAAYCTDVPLCILLALHTQVQLAAVALTPRVPPYEELPLFHVACQLASPRGDRPTPLRGALYIHVCKAFFAHY